MASPQDCALFQDNSHIKVVSNRSNLIWLTEDEGSRQEAARSQGFDSHTILISSSNSRDKHASRMLLLNEQQPLCVWVRLPGMPTQVMTAKFRGLAYDIVEIVNKQLESRRHVIIESSANNHRAWNHAPIQNLMSHSSLHSSQYIELVILAYTVIVIKPDPTE